VTEAEEDRRVLTGSHFMNGDTACAEGAMAAGCTFFGGYPITPSTEIAERLAARLPEVGGVYIQMEDELASMASILGASWAGARSMTATSGPGFSLMQENIGLGAMTETPCVVVNVQRGGPSTGLPTLVAQADMMQARWGSHGDYPVIAYCPSSCQEMFELTLKAFNTADLLRTPVMVMADETVGHMTERVVIPERDTIELVERKRPTVGPAELPRVFEADESLVPPMPRAGRGYRIHVTGLTHDERGYPATDAETNDALVRRLAEKLALHAPEIIEVEEIATEDAEVVLVAYGSTSRSAKRAVIDLRAAGEKVGLFRLITAWPFPVDRVAELAERGCRFVVPELNLGQMALEVERVARQPVVKVNHAGGLVMPPATIIEGVREAMAWRRENSLSMATH
jgi:2-oxoglutarate/2-oxoacid ferredoxin oxidoreductase subunit alpha